MSHRTLLHWLLQKDPGGAKDMLTNALIKLSPPCIRQNEGVFSTESIPGGRAWESCVLELEGAQRSGGEAAQPGAEDTP